MTVRKHPAEARLYGPTHECIYHGAAGHFVFDVVCQARLCPFSGSFDREFMAMNPLGEWSFDLLVDE
jgi:hypothetical protein